MIYDIVDVYRLYSSEYSVKDMITQLIGEHDGLSTRFAGCVIRERKGKDPKGKGRERKGSKDDVSPFIRSGF